MYSSHFENFVVERTTMVIFKSSLFSFAFKNMVTHTTRNTPCELIFCSTCLAFTTSVTELGELYFFPVPVDSNES